MINVFISTTTTTKYRTLKSIATISVSTSASSSVKQYEHSIDIQNDSEIIDENKIDM